VVRGCLYHTRGSLGPEGMRLALCLREPLKVANPRITLPLSNLAF